jgi:hypothetical protein
MSRASRIWDRQGGYARHRAGAAGLSDGGGEGGGVGPEELAGLVA